MADVILLYPRIGRDVKGISIDLPLSVLAVASTLVQDYEVEIIDQRVHQNWKEKLRRELEGDTICVGISSMTGSQIGYGLEMARFVREVCGDVPIVWGGVHSTLLPEQTLQHPLVDIVVIGEGELIMRNLVCTLKKRRNLNEVKGICYKRRGNMTRTGPEALSDLNILPDLPYELIDIEQYVAKKTRQLPGVTRMLPFFSSRGCAHACTFCCNPGLSKRRWRAMSAENTYEKVMSIVERFTLDGVTFHDEEFLMDIKRAGKIADLIGGQVRWNIQGRMDALARMDLKRLERDGLGAVQPGLESGSPRILRFIKKGETVNDFAIANQALRRTGIVAMYNFMVGIPTETYEDLMSTIDLALKMLAENPNARIGAFSMYVPYPGTELFNFGICHGLQAPHSMDGWIRFSRQHLETPWVQDKLELLNNVMLTFKLVDGHYFRAILSKYHIPSFLLSIVGKWYQHRWQRHVFGRTIDVILLEHISDYLRKKE